jgi:hypothetical protein
VKAVLPKAGDQFANVRRTLIESGVLDEKGVEDITKALEQSTIAELSGNARNFASPLSLNEGEKLASSITAALALNMSPGSSSSLIVAGAIKRYIASAVMVMGSRKKALQALSDITADPQRFVDIVSTAKNEQEAARLFLTEIVGTAQANAILNEEENR